MSLPSVTQVISPFTDFSRVPSEVLEHAAARGTKVHAACAAIAQGLWVPPLEPEVAGYVQSFRDWFEAVVVEVALVEEELVCRDLGVCGHPDLVCRLRGDAVLSVIDLKTPAQQSRTWRAQLAAYQFLADQKIPNRVGRVMALRLKKDGKPPTVDEYTRSADDFNAFLSALNAYRWFSAQ